MRLQQVFSLWLCLYYLPTTWPPPLPTHTLIHKMQCLSHLPIIVCRVAVLVLNSQCLRWIALPAALLERHQLWKCWQTEKAAESFLMKIRKLFLLSLYHQNNKHAGTDSIGLPHWKFTTATASAVKKLQSVGKEKAGPEQIFTFHTSPSFVITGFSPFYRCQYFICIVQNMAMTSSWERGPLKNQQTLNPLQQKSVHCSHNPWLCTVGCKYTDICLNMMLVLKTSSS